MGVQIIGRPLWVQQNILDTWNTTHAWNCVQTREHNLRIDFNLRWWYLQCSLCSTFLFWGSFNDASGSSLNYARGGQLDELLRPHFGRKIWQNPYLFFVKSNRTVTTLFGAGERAPKARRASDYASRLLTPLLSSVHWYDDWQMMNCKGFGRK